jgi:SH3-like domain-containing protein
MAAILAILTPPGAAWGFTVGTTTGLPLPRFVSLRADEVNLRTGPGLRYPIEWVYTRKNLPVEVIAEYDVWRKVRDWQGTEGWVHESMLSSRRMMVVMGTPRKLRESDNDHARTLAVVDPGVIGHLDRCPGGDAYCEIEINGIHGWLRRDQIWGVYPDERVG